MESTKKLILYRELENEKLFCDLTSMIEEYRKGDIGKSMAARFYECIHGLVELAASHGFSGNLWHAYIAYLLVNGENAYSRACEIRGAAGGSLDTLAAHDFKIIKEYFDFNLNELGERFGVDCMDEIINYVPAKEGGNYFNKRIRDRIGKLCRFLERSRFSNDLQNFVTEFYREFGVGRLGLHKAFRVEAEDARVQIVPVTNIAHVHLDDLIGYESAKQKLIDNTEAFVSGREANNCLLYGDAGTGKSTAIKAIANQYFDRGLRLIEVYKHQFQHIHDVIAQIKNRNYKFILYMDDLSFEEFETEYKYLKAIIEGGLEKKPDNVLIYATSNRRHLIRENFSDKEELRQDMHTSDTVQEKLSLYTRFGVTIRFGAPNPKEFEQIVLGLARQYHISMEDEVLLAEANQWELAHGGRSGRTARQFIGYLLGKV